MVNKRLQVTLGLLVLLALMALFLDASGVWAQGGGDTYPPGVDPDDVYAISHRLYCDVCEGVPLSDCPTDQCRVWREEIADLLYEGKTTDEIRQHFATRYGDKVTGVPLSRTARLITYGTLFGLIGLVTVGLGWQLYRWRNKTESRALQVARSAGTLQNYQRPVPDNVDAAYLERVLDALEKQNL